MKDRSEQDRKKALARRNALKRRYGITPEIYEQMLQVQNGRCAICRRLPGRRRLAVDHDHATKAVRGLLCFHCNKYLVAKNTLKTAQAVVEYLWSHRYDWRF